VSSSNNGGLPPSSPPKSYSEQRLESLAGHELYPHKFSVTTTVDQLHRNYGHLAAGEGTMSKDDDSHMHSLAGMVRGVRTAGRHLRFIDLTVGEQKLQLIVRSDWLRDNAGAQMQLIEQLRRGDRIGRQGRMHQKALKFFFVVYAKNMWRGYVNFKKIARSERFL
jgi:lysyl-tRNA synthetase class II